MSTKDRGAALIFPFVFVLQGDREAEQAWPSSLHWDPCLLETGADSGQLKPRVLLN